MNYLITISLILQDEITPYFDEILEEGFAAAAENYSVEKMREIGKVLADENRAAKNENIESIIKEILIPHTEILIMDKHEQRKRLYAAHNKLYRIDIEDEIINEDEQFINEIIDDIICDVIIRVEPVSSIDASQDDVGLEEAKRAIGLIFEQSFNTQIAEDELEVDEEMEEEESIRSEENVAMTEANQAIDLIIDQSINLLDDISFHEADRAIDMLIVKTIETEEEAMIREIIDEILRKFMI